MYRGFQFSSSFHRRCTSGVAELSSKIPLEPSFSLPTPQQLRIIRAESLITTVYRYSRADLRESLQAMQKQVAGMENPLIEAGSFTTGGHRVAFRHQGKLVEPIAG